MLSYWKTLASWPVACSRVSWACWRAKSASRKATHLSLSSSRACSISCSVARPWSNFACVDLERFLRQLQVEARHFAARVQLADVAGFLLHVEANLLALVAERQLGGAQLAFRQGDVGARSWRRKAES